MLAFKVWKNSWLTQFDTISRSLTLKPLSGLTKYKQANPKSSDLHCLWALIGKVKPQLQACRAGTLLFTNVWILCSFELSGIVHPHLWSRVRDVTSVIANKMAMVGVVKGSHEWPIFTSTSSAITSTCRLFGQRVYLIETTLIYGLLQFD